MWLVLGHLPHEERLEDGAWFSLERRQLQGYLKQTPLPIRGCCSWTLAFLSRPQREGEGHDTSLDVVGLAIRKPFPKIQVNSELLP